MAKMSEITIVLRYLSEVYQVPTTKEKVRVYHTVMGDIARLRIVDAATVWVSKEKWFPKPSELLGCLSKVGKTLDPTTESMWWAAFIHGYDNSDDLNDDDVSSIYADAGVEMVGDIKLPAGALNDDPDVINYRHTQK